MRCKIWQFHSVRQSPKPHGDEKEINITVLSLSNTNRQNNYGFNYPNADTSQSCCWETNVQSGDGGKSHSSSYRYLLRNFTEFFIRQTMRLKAEVAIANQATAVWVLKTLILLYRAGGDKYDI